MDDDEDDSEHDLRRTWTSDESESDVGKETWRSGTKKAEVNELAELQKEVHRLKALQEQILAHPKEPDPLKVKEVPIVEKVIPITNIQVSKEYIVSKSEEGGCVMLYHSGELRNNCHLDCYLMVTMATFLAMPERYRLYEILGSRAPGTSAVLNTVKNLSLGLEEHGKRRDNLWRHLSEVGGVGLVAEPDEVGDPIDLHANTLRIDYVDGCQENKRDFMQEHCLRYEETNTCKVCQGINPTRDVEVPYFTVRDFWVNENEVRKVFKTLEEALHSELLSTCMRGRCRNNHVCTYTRKVQIPLPDVLVLDSVTTSRTKNPRFQWTQTLRYNKI